MSILFTRHAITQAIHIEDSETTTQTNIQTRLSYTLW